MSILDKSRKANITRERISPWIFAFLAQISLLLQERELFRRRYSSALGVLLLCAILWQRRKEVLALPHKQIGSFLFVSSLLPSVLLKGSLALPLISWSFVLYLTLSPSENADASASKERSGYSALIFVLSVMTLSFLLIGFLHYVIWGDFAMIIDEVLYVLQSTLFKEPEYARSIDETLRPFFGLRQASFVDGRFYGQYPPGWPFVLMLFSIVKLTWWSNVILAALSIPATYFLGKQLFCHSAGVVAVVLVATNPLFIFFGATYFPHILGMLLVALSGFLILYGERKTPWQKPGWLITGFLVSVLVTVRPLTGVCVGVSLAVWLILRKKIERKELLMFFLLLGAGGALPIAGLLHFNAVTNGNALTFGYQVSHGHLHDLGFGKRGFVAYDGHGNATESAVDFTPRLALKQLLERIHDMDSLLFPGFMILPLIFAGYVYGFQFRWNEVLAFLVLPVVHAFYFYGSIRFLLELLPFLCAGIAAIVVFLGSKRRSLAISLLLFMLISNTTRVIWDQYQYYYKVSRRLRSYIEMVKNFQTAHGKVIIFVRAHRTRGEYLLEHLYWFNIKNFPGNIIVARDIGDRNSVLIKRFPEYVPMYLVER